MTFLTSSCRLTRAFALGFLAISTGYGTHSAGAQEAAATPGIRQLSAPGAAAPISLEPMTDQERAALGVTSDAKSAPAEHPNYRDFGTVRAGETTAARALTLRFAAAGKLTKIEATKDAVVEQGGSCVEGNVYAANATCTLMVRFTPQGPGHRLAKVAVTSSAGVTPLFVGIGGNGSAPAISFTPSIISTVPGTYVSGAGIFSGATNLATDGGDNLYIADTGNNQIDVINSSGAINPANTYFIVTAPVGIGVDSTGAIYYTKSAQNFLTVINDPYDQTFYNSGGNFCSVGTTCTLNGTDITISNMGSVAVDPYGSVFIASDERLNKLVPSPDNFNFDYIPLYTGNGDYNYDFPNSPQPLAVDSQDTLYYYTNYYQDAACRISGEPYYVATAGFDDAVIIAGNTCGFSGDGGQARSAEIGRLVSQMTFDIAGNLYFTDTQNQRVRRIDNATGIISTIAGNGGAGYGGDNGPATSATLNTPTGVAVDSQGQVYILSNSATTGTAQVVRKVGTVGALNLGTVAVGSSAGAQTVTLANTGNSNLDFTHVGFSSGNTGDFTMDVNTTSCNFTVPLASGRSCKIGFIFKPMATGARSAVFSITDDTVTGLNTIQLSGAGATTATLTPSSLSFASTTVGSTSSSQTVTLANTGSAALTISSIAFSGAAAYTDTTTCGTSLAVGASCTIAISFKPAAAGAQNGTLTVTDNALGSRQTVSLTGPGVASAAKASISPTSLTFSSTAVGSSSAAQVITLSNTGGAALGVTSIKVAGTNAPDYTQTNTCGTSVAAGGSCKITVTFKPTGTGTRTASVAIVASAGNINATLTGTAVAAAAKAVLTPGSASFGSQVIATASGERMMTLTNSGAATMSISSWSWSGANTSDFSQIHTCGATMVAGAACVVAAVFRPTELGDRTATLTIHTAGGDVVVTLTGTGISGAGQMHQMPLRPGLWAPVR